jgi:hypothetical protein
MQAWREVVAAAMISAVKPDETASNFQERDNALRTPILGGLRGQHVRI